MPSDRLDTALEAELSALVQQGTSKGDEDEITAIVPASEGRGPRYRLAGEGERDFLRMNSNSYLGLSLEPTVIAAEEKAASAFGTGPGAVRFISGTFSAHVELEHQLASFHGRDAAMIMSAAYATVLGVLVTLLSADTVVISDELNHNCIINALRLARPKDKKVYRHLDMADLEEALTTAAGQAKRAIIVTDGIFSMRGDHAPVPEIMALARRFDAEFPENVVVVMDDSHGVGAFGATGRGTEEATGSEPVDVLIATLGKALGVNGGYVVGSQTLIRYLREKAPLYIYSNPITPAEAAAASASLGILDSASGRQRLDHLREMTARFRQGLIDRGFETLPGEHPVVPLMVRDTQRTAALVKHLKSNGVLATGLNYPVVPKGDEEIRFQISADHTATDIEECLKVLASFEA